MSCARTSRRRPRGRAGTVFGKPHFRLALSFLAVAGLTRAMPATAQPITSSPAGSSPGAPPPLAHLPPASARAARRRRILPPVPSGPFGLPNPLTPPNALPNGITLAAGRAAALFARPVVPGSRDHPAPAVQSERPGDPGPTLRLDRRAADRQCQLSPRPTGPRPPKPSLIPGVSISADTPRLKGVLERPGGGRCLYARPAIWTRYSATSTRRAPGPSCLTGYSSMAPA